MGYFPNGSAGMDYTQKYCDRCIHGDEDGCAVMLAHLLHNYDECNKKDSILHLLIPKTKDGLGNEQCTMFVKSVPQAPESDGPKCLECERCKQPTFGRLCSDCIGKKVKP